MRGSDGRPKVDTNDLPVGVMAPIEKGPDDFEIRRFFPLEVDTPKDMDRLVTGEARVILPHVGPYRQYAIVLRLGGPEPLANVLNAIKLAQREIYGTYQTLLGLYKKSQA